MKIYFIIHFRHKMANSLLSIADLISKKKKRKLTEYRFRNKYFTDTVYGVKLDRKCVLMSMSIIKIFIRLGLVISKKRTKVIGNSFFQIF